MSVEADARAAYIAETVAAAPPLSDEQMDLIAVILQGGIAKERAARGPSPAELERRRQEAERLAAYESAKKLSASLMACDACDLPPEAHTAQRAHGAFHEWQPGRAEKIMQRKVQK